MESTQSQTELVSEVESLLAAFSDAEAVLAVCRAEDRPGFRRTPGGHPVSNLIVSRFRKRVLSAGVPLPADGGPPRGGLFAKTDPYRAAEWIDFVPPPPVVEFLRRFDAGEFPDLDLHDVTFGSR